MVGGGANRERSGTGLVASFSLVCVQPIENGQIAVDDSPIRETRLVLSDGISEQRFRTVQGMEISVTGIELRDIPDVILLPGQSDSLTISNLRAFVSMASIPIDSLNWTYIPTNFDSLEIEIDPLTTRVKITPVDGWIGRRQVTWIASEPTARIQGLEPLSAAEVSTIIVNNPPQFTVARGADGVKRDTIRILEDQYPFLSDQSILDPARAFSWFDLDNIVEDPDITDPQKELNFAPLVYGGFGPQNNLRSQVVAENHQLLLWAKAEFSGIDSFKVMVRDGLRGGEDSLRVIVIVEGVNDAPRFVIDDKNPKISRGGFRTYRLDGIVEDPDTPLENLEFTWTDDPGEHFKVETAAVDTTLAITVRGARDFAGIGRITFVITDPEDPINLTDQVILFFTASESLPPDIFPPEIKIDLIPGGESFTEALDDFVEDPDNSVEELAWLLPAKTYQSLIGIDENRTLEVSAPLEFTGYEEVTLTVSDPNDQSDILKLRIYSSDEDPVVGGIPDLIMDRGEENREIDLDNYYFDSDNRDEEVFWEVLKTFDERNLQVSIDPITHVATLFALETAAFKTEHVVFRVIDPAGTAAADTMLVTIRSGGDQGTADFRLRPLPTDLQVPVGQFTNVLDLDDFVEPPDTSVSWSVALIGGDHSIPLIATGDTLRIFGEFAGVDTLQLTARDTIGRVKTATATVRVVGESELLVLLSIPDLQFIAGQSVISDTLNIYIADRVTHPDSVVEWSLETFGPQGDIFPKVRSDNTLFATASDTGTAEVILIARNGELGVAGRDTVRIIALDPALGNTALKAFPPVVFEAGDGDSSIVLNDYLPDELIPADGTIPKVRWTVSRQRITQPIIDTQAPHLLRLRSVGNQIGIDSLTFVADIGGGFRAVGTMEVTVLEEVDSTTLELQVVPNPVNIRYLDLYVIARRELAGTPNVFRTFEASDSTVQVRQLEGDLEERKVMVWSGSVRLPPDASGTVFFQAQASTVLGTDVKDTVSVTIGTVAAGKPLVLGHGAARLSLPVDALPAETSVLIQVSSAGPGDAAAKISGEIAADELELLTVIDLYPAGQVLGEIGKLQVDGERRVQDGIYSRRGSRWEYLGPADRPAGVARLGRFGVLRDEVTPRIHLITAPEEGQLELAVEVVDAGSGVGEDGILLRLDREEVYGEYAGGILRWSPFPQLAAGDHLLELQVRDRAGNQAQMSLTLQTTGQILPQTTELGRSFPNPFNPETTIPFTLAPIPGSSTGGAEVRLAVFNISGQLVRRLLEQEMVPGRYQVQWDGRNAAGQPAGSGIYLYRLETPGGAWTRRMTLLK